jgi:peptidoglycan/LPS O-acetylase OafA/YrhL
MAAAAVPAGRVFHTLDALRGIAAIGVVVFHLSAAFTPMAAPGGYLAVDLFFMMSGVVLSHAYEARFQAGMGTFGFMRARLIRLYPLYLLGTLFGMVVTLASLLGRNSNQWNLSSLLEASLLGLMVVPDFFTGRANRMLFPLNIPSWSLFLELLVNLLFVAAWPRLTSRRLMAIASLSGGAVVLAIAHQGNIDQGSVGASLAGGLARTLFGFSVGVLIARHLRRLPSRQSNLGVLAIVAVVLVAIVGWPTGELRAVWDAVCVLVVFPLVVYAGTAIDPSTRLQRVATFLGVTSYAIYVLHSPLFSLLHSTLRVGAPYLGIAVLALLLIGCWLVDRYVDMPIRRRLNRISRGGVRAAVTPPGSR